MKIKSFILAAASVLAVAGANAGEEDLVKYRTKLMDILGGHMGSITAIVKSEVPYKEDLAYHAKGLAEAAPLIRPSFETKAMTDKSEALPKLWDNREDFEKMAMELEEASADLSTAISTGDRASMGRALNAVGKSCKGCHDEYTEEH